MKAFNSDESLKAKVLAETLKHQELDAFIQGAWLREEKTEEDTFKGCFYGCQMQTSIEPLGTFSEAYNIDLWYVHLTEKIFEGLPVYEAKKFPLQALEVVPVGFDFEKIKSKFHYELLMDQANGQINFCGRNQSCIDAVTNCAELFRNDFSSIDESAAWSATRFAESAAGSAWSAARSAESAAWSAARSAARSAESAARSARSARSAESAESAVEFAAWSAESAAESAARSAESAAWSAESAARSAVEFAYYMWLRDLLFQLIKNNS